MLTTIIGELTSKSHINSRTNRSLEGHRGSLQARATSIQEPTDHLRSAQFEKSFNEKVKGYKSITNHLQNLF